MVEIVGISDDQQQSLKRRPPLGSVEIPEDALNQDWRLADGYNAYSAELLRLSLLAITGIATLCVKLHDAPGRKFADIIYIFILPISAFLLSAGCALAHRFIAIDSMAFHLASLRLYVRSLLDYPDSVCQNLADLNKGKSEVKERDLRFWLAARLLWVSASALFLGLALSARSLARC